MVKIKKGIKLKPGIVIRKPKPIPPKKQGSKYA